MNTKRVIRWVIVLFLLAALPVMTAVMAQGEVPAAKQLPVVMEPGESAAPETYNTYETEPNNTLATADYLWFGEVIGGKIDTVGDVDYFRIHPDRATNVLIDIDGQSILSSIDSVVCLLDHQGNELACNDDTDTWDSLVYYHLTSREDEYGDAYIRVTDYGDYHGGSDHFYELILSNPLLVSSSVNGTVAGIPFKSGDILAWSDLPWNDSEKWVLFFDASDVGITKNLWNVAQDEFWDDQDQQMILLMGFSANQPLAGLGTVTPWDIVRFHPIRYGPATEGAFSWYLRGRDTGLTTSGEKIDAVIGDIGLHSFAWCYGPAISTTGTAKVGGERFQDDDLLCGEGGWSIFTDGAEVPGLAAEDVVAADYSDTSSGELVYLTILGNGRISGYPISQKDIFAITYLYPSIWHHLQWHGPDHGWNYNIDAFEWTGW